MKIYVFEYAEPNSTLKDELKILIFKNKKEAKKVSSKMIRKGLAKEPVMYEVNGYDGKEDVYEFYEREEQKILNSTIEVDENDLPTLIKLMQDFANGRENN